MPHIARLPNSMRYLQPFAESLERRAAEPLVSTPDPQPLIDAIRAHFQPADPELAHELFRDDVGRLGRWLEIPGREEHPAQWIGGYLQNLALYEILDDPVPAVGQTVRIDVPDGWTRVVTPGETRLQRQSLRAEFWPVPPDRASALLEDMAEPLPADPLAPLREFNEKLRELLKRDGSEIAVPHPPYAIGNSKVVTEVSYGEVTGRKCVFWMLQPCRHKIVEFCLKVPGGNVHLTIQSKGKQDVEVDSVETCLSSLRVDEF